MCTQKLAMKPEVCPTSQTLWCRPNQATALRQPQVRPVCLDNLKGVVGPWEHRDDKPVQTTDCLPTTLVTGD